MKSLPIHHGTLFIDHCTGFVMLSGVHVVFIIAVWWAASSLTSISSKEAMKTHSDVGVNFAFRDMRWLELTALQLLLGTIVSMTLTRGDHKTSPSRKGASWRLHLPAFLGHLIGNMATNASLAAVHSSVTIIIKACEPLFTILVCYYFYNNTPKVIRTSSVLVMCFGAMLFIASDVSYNAWGLWAAVISNIAFPIRNITVKDHLDGEGPFNTYRSMSMYGFVLLLPIVMVKLIITQRMPILELTDSFVSCVSHVLYNIASLCVLEKVLPLNYAILNLSKRIIAVFANILYFHTPFTYVTHIGLIIFVCGNILYGFTIRNTKVTKSIYALIFLLCTLTKPWNTRNLPLNQLFPDQKSPNIMTSWVFDQPIPSEIVDNIKNINNRYPAGSMTVYCGTSYCMEAINNLNNTQITPIFMEIDHIVKDTPLQDWFIRHSFNKVLAGAEFEHHLQNVVQLGLLWHYGGMYIDPTIIINNMDLDNQNNRSWIVNETCESVKITDRGILDISNFPRQNEFINRLAVDFVKLYPKFNNNNTAWSVPFDVRPSQWDVFRQCSDSVKCPRSKSADIGKLMLSKGNHAHYGTLDFDKLVQMYKSINIGDTIQSYPGLQFLPFVDTFIERDAMSLSKSDVNVTAFLNAFWGEKNTEWPPPDNVHPILVSMHTEPIMKERMRNNLAYLKTHEPIGCRDMDTYAFFKSIGVQTYFSSCMTLMLNNPYPDSYRTDDIYLVDVSSDVQRFIPKDVLNRATLVRHRSVLPG